MMKNWRYAIAIAVILVDGCNYYKVTDTHVYHIAWTEGGKIQNDLDSANPKEFKSLNGHFGKDDRNALRRFPILD